MDWSRVAPRSFGGLTLAFGAAAALLGTTGLAKADVFAIANQASFGNGLIETVDLTTHTFVNSFIPDQAKIGQANGRGVEVLGNFVYYTELTNGFDASNGIFVAPFNNGAGGADIKSFPNPVPGTGIVDLAASGGALFAMTGYPAGPEVVQKTDGNGNNIGSLVTLHDLGGASLADSDGFTVLSNGNWLINSGDAVNSYSQFDPLTGNEIAGTTIQAHDANGVCGQSTGVDNDAFLGGSSLYFDCGLNSIVQDDLSGNFIATTPLSTGDFEDISLVQETPINPPATPEPASLSILGAALAGLGLARRRRRSS
jgi:hypothetical protein